ncbi:subfamily B ATP-binding cassette protein MsbA [Pullulanibacillus pueri]|uniref:Putative multidrug export ATP-binding/permease protein YgaD n=1 Tax=Pullulanibacillus pueri TaxID=1437324 RepID=A0A8J2ZYX1_9BACL|nr:ABC transporter ATP-binding protein [Pullulanibacillus pueri]MBM7680697.1 subfamily B ATP-binding cassette protein MsbA [Pullulanibacillus pueri]GGH87535.1 putative multidrug export ATP-binding/permease protein YgaD [Pullulanibacillus pueri]
MKFVYPYKKEIIITIFIGILKFGIPLALPLILKYVIDDIINTSLATDQKLHKLFYVTGIALFVFVIIRPPVEYYRQYYAQWTGNKILYDIRDRLFDHLQRLSLRFFSNNKAGEVISRVINDVEQTKAFVMTGLMNIWLDMSTIVIALAIMVTMSPLLTLISICMFPFYGLSIKIFYTRLRMLTRKRSQALAEVQGHLHERVSGMNVIKSFALEDHEQQEFAKRNHNFLNRAIDHTTWNAKTFAVVNTITDVAPLLVIMIGAYELIVGGLSEIGTVVAFFGYMDRLYGPLRRLVSSSTTLTQSIASMDRVFELMDEKYDIVDDQDAQDIHEVRGRITFNHVSFNYHEDETAALKNINLDVEPGETIALVGMSGGGKSTLVSLIPRFYDVTQGSILIDGKDIRKIKVRQLRDKIGMVLQDSVLFSESIRSNIMMGNPEATEEEVIAAAKAANAHDFILKLPQGYDTQVGERGVKLSGGQKQRISIARVFLKNPPLLILDEATSALDLESEHLIQGSLEDLAKNRTTFIVAHRLSTITHADRIVVIENGEITEMGNHYKLMERKGSYYDLFQVQQLEG